MIWGYWKIREDSIGKFSRQQFHLNEGEMKIEEDRED
jgi:hypothetical protein